MNCAKYTNFFDEYLKGELTHEISSDLENHLKNCKRCLEEFNLHKSIVAELSKVSVPDPGENYFKESYEAILRKINEKQLENVLTSSRTYKIKDLFGFLLNKRILAYALPILILITAAVLLTKNLNHNNDLILSSIDLSITDDAESEIIDDYTSSELEQASLLEIFDDENTKLSSIENYLTFYEGEDLMDSAYIQNELSGFNDKEVSDLLNSLTKS